jgi:uracil-DNA glycosylase
MNRQALLREIGIDVWVSRMPEQQPEENTFGIEEVRQRAMTCQACGLAQSRTNVVFGVGSEHADVMIIGEAPGRDEDLQGEPFVGRAGKLLDAMLQAVGLARATVYIANILKCRPPNNRDPAGDEVQACIGFLHQQMEHIAPKVILCVGRVAAQNLLGVATPIGKLRGVVHEYHGTPVIVGYHPAYLLRSPKQKAQAWEDLKLLMRYI